MSYELRFTIVVFITVFVAYEVYKNNAYFNS